MKRNTPHFFINCVRALSGPLVVVLLAGSCRQEPDATVPPTPTPRPAPVQPLRVVVVDDDAVSQAAATLRGEWVERTGGNFELFSVTEAELPGVAKDADLLIYPSRWLGELVANKSILPLRKPILEDKKYDWPAVHTALSDRECAIGLVRYAFPLGSPPLLIALRKDLADSLKHDPLTWEALDQQLSQAEGSDPPRESSASDASAKPALLLAWDGHAPAYALLARVAAGTWSQARPDVLFDSQTMTPRIASPPFVEALQFLSRWAGPGLDAANRPRDFHAAVSALRSGDGFATLGWPGVDRRIPVSMPQEFRFFLLPGAMRRYDWSRDQWDALTEASRPQLLGVAGRVISVSRSTRNRVNAFQLAVWLSNPQNQPQLTKDSPYAMWCRRAGVTSARHWLGGADRDGDANVLETALLEAHIDLTPRLPGSNRYLDVLADAVRQAVGGQLPSDQSLADAATRWETITDELGRTSQASAYRRHLGLEEMKDP